MNVSVNGMTKKVRGNWNKVTAFFEDIMKKGTARKNALRKTNGRTSSRRAVGFYEQSTTPRPGVSVLGKEGSPNGGWTGI